ncbi:hypothetical protein BH11BAC4_BH11BAC4_12860 [soil metagenome]
MKILVLATDDGWNELTVNNNAVEWIRAEDVNAFFVHKEADACFNLNSDAAEINYSEIKKPVFIHCVIKTLKEINAHENIYRINGWRGFIKRDSWEVAGNISKESVTVLTAISKKYVSVPDEPGLIAARIIAMIINEAYFAKAENVSTEKEIDIAMKLGTNYPFGPFEWAQLIGIKNVYDLLMSISQNDNRYKPAELLQQEAIKN